MKICGQFKASRGGVKKFGFWSLPSAGSCAIVKAPFMSTQLDQLKQFTTVVADSGDFATLKQYAPRDATTNPSLIFKAAQMPEYKYILDKVVADGKQANASADAIIGNLLITFGTEILKIVPGRVSTETDANLS